MTPPRKKVGEVRRTQSRNTVPTPQPTTYREQRLGPETRRTSSLKLFPPNHRTPIDCPFPRCNAATVHQHCGQLQFYNPHPANEIQHRGYASSLRATLSQPSVTNGTPATQAQKMLGPQKSGDREASPLSPRDPVTSRRTLEFVEDLLTPPQTFPMDIDYDTIADAWDSGAERQQPEVSSSPELENILDEWLVPKAPE